MPRPLRGTDWAKALVLGVLVSVLLSIVAIAGMASGVSPMSEPLGLAFAKVLLSAEGLPLPVGLLFHMAWVTLWTVAFVAFSRDALTFGRALALGLGLWVVVLVLFFPVVGWGFFGMAEGRALIVGSLVPHLLFSIFLWAGCRLFFGERAAAPQI